MFKEISFFLLSATLFAAIACGGGSGGDSSTTALSTTGTATLRAVTGSITEDIAGAIVREASSYSFSEIDEIKFIDDQNNAYIATITNGVFTVNLPVGGSYTASLTASDEFVAVLTYNSTNWFELQTGSAALNFGEISVNLTTQFATPANDPWEGNAVDSTSPFVDTDNDGVPDILLVAVVSTSTTTGTVDISSNPTLANAPWPCAKGNFKRTAKSAYAAPSSAPSAKWSYTIETGNVMTDGLVIGADNTIYFISSAVDGLIALDPSDASLKWQTTAGNSPTLMSDGYLYCIGQDGLEGPPILLKVVTSTGELTDDSTGAKRAGASLRSFGAFDTTYVIQGGETYSTFRLKNWSDDSAVTEFFLGAADTIPPAISSSASAFLVCGAGLARAYNKSGELAWSKSWSSLGSTGLILGLGGPPSAFDRNGNAYLLFVTEEGPATPVTRLLARNAAGTDIWSTKVKSLGASYWDMALDEVNAIIYVTDTISAGANSTIKVTALNANTGVQLWTYSSATFSYTDHSYKQGGRIVIDKNGSIVFTAGDKKVYCVDKDGVLKWSYTLAAVPVSTPVITATGGILVGCDDNKLYSIGQ